MRIVNCEQRSPEWYAARLGIPTASAMGKLITPAGKARKGATRDAYLLSLLAERLMRKIEPIPKSRAMERGCVLEPFARRYYEENTGRIVDGLGFATDDSGRFGCSPDGVCWKDGVMQEIKCPETPAFMRYMTSGEIPYDHYVQMQTSMLILGLMACDYIVYHDHPAFVPIIKRVEADIPFQSALMSVLVAACDELDAMERMMRDAGHGVPADTPLDLSDFEEEWTVGEEQKISEVE